MMLKVVCLSALLVLGLVHFSHSEANENGNSDIWVDDQGKIYSESQASGDDQEQSGDNGDYEPDLASGGGIPPRKLSHCEKIVANIRDSGQVGAFIPRCTETGEYEATQCSASTGECWCVNYKGEEIPGTIAARPWKPTCDSTDRSRSYSRNDQTIKIEPDQKVGGAPTEPPDDDDDFESDFTNKPDKDEKPNGPVIDTLPNNDELPDDTQVGHPDGTKEHLGSNSILRQPLMLAGLIAIAVVCLLCAVLLVMFIVYRMRKKDEGSYALDEPKRSPSHPYQRAPNKEFFA